MAHGNHMIQPAIIDVIGPAITTKDPDRFLDKVITSIKDVGKQGMGGIFLIDHLKFGKLFYLAPILPGSIGVMHVLQPSFKRLFQLF